MMSSMILIYIVGLISFILNRHHLIMLLMSIEFMYLSLMLMFLLMCFQFNMLSIFMFMVLIVCEAALGLSILVSMSFYYGNEMMNSMNLIKC
uniref:NADH dehydrogenase subunit 4L n=1 Tax=Bothriocroton hydrosauri TaxID=59643 RepID=UPI0030FE4116